MVSSHNVVININADECIVSRYGILVALMKCSQKKDKSMQTKLSKLIHTISLEERETKNYVNAVNVKVSGNEVLLKYIQENA